MERVKMIRPNQMVWVMDDNGYLKMIIAEKIYWNEEDDMAGWDIMSGDEVYWIECCFELSHPILEN